MGYLINNKIKEGDTIIVESLSRLSRGGVIRTLDLITRLIQERKINVHVFKENFYLNAGEKPDANTNLLLGIFSVLGQFERDLLSERIKEAFLYIFGNNLHWFCWSCSDNFCNGNVPHASSVSSFDVCSFAFPPFRIDEMRWFHLLGSHQCCQYKLLFCTDTFRC